MREIAPPPHKRNTRLTGRRQGGCWKEMGNRNYLVVLASDAGSGTSDDCMPSLAHTK